MDTSALEAMAIEEVEGLHRSFEQIFAGDASALDRVDAALASSFAMVPPSGEIVDRAQVLTGLAGALGVQQVTIRILNPRLRWASNDGVFVSYEEWQESTSGTTARQATVLFEIDESAPGGLRWVWVHETWVIS